MDIEEKPVSIILPCAVIDKVKMEKPADIFLSAWWVKVILAGLDKLKGKSK
jgi:hypothetical protein